MTRTLLLRFVAVCHLLRAVFLFGLRRFPARPGLDGRFASQNRKMTRTPLLRFVDVCRLLQAVFLFGLRRFSRSSRIGTDVLLRKTEK